MGGALIKKLSIVLLLALTAYPVFAQVEAAQVVSNSARWQDVYSTMLFANLNGQKGFFLVSKRHSTLLINQLGRSGSLYIVTSKREPFVVGYGSLLETRGFSVNEVSEDNINLALARELDVKNFIVLDDSYGYNAISVAPYAILNKAYVLFADRRNINQIYTYLFSRQVNELILYGQTDREVKDRLSEFNPIIINQGDRFSNNLAIVDRYQELHTKLLGNPKKQAILTNGEFIESEIMSGVEPVVFIGRANVPDQVRDYIQQSDIDIGILIGNELVGTATFIRRQLGISVFVKFAQSARAPEGPISAVEDLDRFYLPRYILNMDLYRVRYNQFNDKLEVTYQNKVDLSAYFKGTITLTWESGSQTVGDDDPIFIDKSEYKTIVYDVEPMQGNISAELFTVYGEAKNSLEQTLRKTMDVEVVNIEDNSQIEILGLRYDKRSSTFLVEIKNVGQVDVYVDLELFDMLINDELVSFGPKEVTFIRTGQTVSIPVKVLMEEEDIENNPQIKVRAYYGERERSLIKMITGEFTYSFTGLSYITGQILRGAGEKMLFYAPLIIIAILLLLILSMKKKCPHCEEVNNLRSKRCRKCGRDI